MDTNSTNLVIFKGGSCEFSIRCDRPSLAIVQIYGSLGPIHMVVNYADMRKLTFTVRNLVLVHTYIRNPYRILLLNVNQLIAEEASVYIKRCVTVFMPFCLMIYQSQQVIQCDHLDLSPWGYGVLEKQNFNPNAVGQLFVCFKNVNIKSHVMVACRDSYEIFHSMDYKPAADSSS